MSDPRSQIPSVEKLLQRPEIKLCANTLQHNVQVRIIQSVLQKYRGKLKKTKTTNKIKTNARPLNAEVIEAEVLNEFSIQQRPSLRKVINATGIVLHTNLGRAPLGRSILQEMSEELAGYTNLEFDLPSGLRGERTGKIESLLTLLTSAEAAIAVNNNAAALILALQTLAKGTQVAISRGELVQIGGGFRVPEIIESSGAMLKEVGTTNITKLKDYEKAIETGAKLILKVHQSNFYQSGHTETVSYEALGALCKNRKIPFLIDLGSGNLGVDPIDMPDHSIREALTAGADLVCFSGDKLFGATQAGMIVGKTKYLSQLKKAPLYRALRLGKTELFILERTLIQLLKNEKPLTLSLLSLPLSEIEKRAQSFVRKLGPRWGAKIIPGTGRVGGGSLPQYELPTYLVTIESPQSERTAQLLRLGTPAVVCRLSHKTLSIDLRTVLEEDEAYLVERLKFCLSSEER